MQALNALNSGDSWHQKSLLELPTSTNDREQLDAWNVSLEEEFGDECFLSDINVIERRILTFLEPNERHPEAIKAHLDLAKKGIIVSVGAQRSLFDLLFSNSECTGLVVRDSNPKVKGFIDFIILLLKISSTRKEFSSLSKIKPGSSKSELPRIIGKKINSISGILANSDLLAKVKDYYLRHLSDYAHLFFETGSQWKYSKDFKSCNYFKEEDLFIKLQMYAKEGNIISTVGDINHLEFLKNRTISIVDTSNVYDYSFINIKSTNPHFKPLIIWTYLTHECKYFSYTHSPLNDTEVAEMHDLMNIMQMNGRPSLIKLRKAVTTDNFNADVGPFYTKGTLQALKEHLKHNFIFDPSLGWIRNKKEEELDEYDLYSCPDF